MSLLVLLYTPPTAFTTTAAVGAFNFTGQSAGLYQGPKALGETGSFALSGQAATFKRGYNLIADRYAPVNPGGAGLLLALGPSNAVGESFLWTGNDVTLQAIRTSPSAVGSFIWTGQDATLNKGYGVVNTVTPFVLTGHSVTFFRSYVVAANVGAYTFAASASTLRDYFLHPEVGTFTLNGKATESILTRPKILAFTRAVTNVRTRTNWG